MPGSRLINRNVVAARGRTSMRLEPELWDALLEICRRERQDINYLVRQIETEGPQRDARHGDPVPLRQAGESGSQVKGVGGNHPGRRMEKDRAPAQLFGPFETGVE